MGNKEADHHTVKQIPTQPSTNAERPAGRAAVTEALAAATQDLLAEKGPTFSVREVADRAGVNQGLIYRHFGSKEKLITAATSGLGTSLEKALADGHSPMRLIADDYERLATTLARLVLDDAGWLVDEHPGVAAMLELARDGGPSAATRVVIAGSAVLGWVLFSEYFANSVEGPVDPDVAELHHTLMEQLLTGEWPTRAEET
jgi:TetR/AcrR family transcriptional regulator, repressor for neighboring sulfatase